MTQAANRAGCSIEWVRRAIKRGKLAAERTPIGHLIRAEDVDRWVAERKAKNEARR